MKELLYSIFKPSIVKAAPLFQDLGGQPIDSAAALEKVIKNAQLFLSTLAGIAAVAVIVWGATIYILAGGEKTRLEYAKKVLTFGIIGLILIIGANVIATFTVILLGGAVR